LVPASGARRARQPGATSAVPRKAVERFAGILREYGLSKVTGDKYAGETFVADFARHGIGYDVSSQTKSELFETLEPRLNAREVVLLDVPLLEQQLLGLVWRGGKIDHPTGEHDDHANATAGAMALTVRGIEPAYGVVEPGPDTSHARPGRGTLWDRRLAAPLWTRR
jgi:hypothetical protein